MWKVVPIAVIVLLFGFGSSRLSAQPGSRIVEIFGEDFRPFDITVEAGDVVTWVNYGGGAHNVRSADGLFASEFLANGSSFSHTFNAPGTFEYRCGVHPFMIGVVHVSGDEPVSTATPPATARPSPTPTRVPRPEITVTAKVFVPSVTSAGAN